MDRVRSIVAKATEEAESGKKRTANELSRSIETVRKEQERQKRLRRSNSYYSVLASLKNEGEKAWLKLSESRKWKKENVLAVLLSRKIPERMTARCWERNAPESIQDDRDILLARLARNDPYFSFHLREQFWQDKEVIIAAMVCDPAVLLQDGLSAELLDDWDIFFAFVSSERMKNPCTYRDAQAQKALGKFSEGIRGNAELMIQAAKTMESVFDHFSTNLACDASFAKQLVASTKKVPTNALERFSEQVRANPKVVLDFVSKNGLCLEHAATSLRGNYLIVRTASRQNALALLLCEPGLTRRELGSDRDFMLDVFESMQESAWNHQEGDRNQLFQMLSADLQSDHEVVVAAHQSESFSTSDLPPSLVRDRDFWLGVIQRDSSLWLKLPDEYKTDPAFARTIRSFDTFEIVESVFSHMPFLSEDREVWKTIICNSHPIIPNDEVLDEDGMSITRLIRKHAPTEVKLERDLMLDACKRDPRVLKLLSSQLQIDREFVAAAAECSEKSSFWALFSISKTAQRLYPELAAQAITKMLQSGLGDYIIEDEDADALDESLWARIDIASAWFQAGGWYHDRFPATIKENQSFGLLVAKHDEDSFDSATTGALRRDKAFMMQAVLQNGRVFSFALGDLRRDFDLAVLAVGGKNSVSFPWYQATNDDKAFFHEVLAKSLEKVQAHENFTQSFIFGMSCNPGPDCSLSILATGVETALALKKLIASFVGVPTGQDLWLHRQVTQNLAIEDLE